MAVIKDLCTYYAEIQLCRPGFHGAEYNATILAIINWYCCCM